MRRNDPQQMSQVDDDLSATRRPIGDMPAEMGDSSETAVDPGGNGAASSAVSLDSPSAEMATQHRDRSAATWGDQRIPEAGGGPDHEPSAGDRAAPDQWEPLMNPQQTEELRGQWARIQAEFVDRPRESVEQADGLVADLMQRVTSSLSQERGRLEAQWEKGENVSTEDLRIALTFYRSFFDRLLSA